PTGLREPGRDRRRWWPCGRWQLGVRWSSVRWSSVRQRACRRDGVSPPDLLAAVSTRREVGTRVVRHRIVVRGHPGPPRSSGIRAAAGGRIADDHGLTYVRSVCVFFLAPARSSAAPSPRRWPGLWWPPPRRRPAR